MSPENGYKITEYIEGTRTCDSSNDVDVKKCMDYLKKFHELNLSVEHEFDLFGQIESVSYTHLKDIGGKKMGKIVIMLMGT